MWVAVYRQYASVTSQKADKAIYVFRRGLDSETDTEECTQALNMVKTLSTIITDSK